MESALRTAKYLLETAQDTICLKASKKNKTKAKPGRSRIEFLNVRGPAGIKKAQIEMAGKKVRVAVVNGIGNIQPILENLKNYDYIEVMACPGGCIGGGGQPIPTDEEIRRKRLAALYKIDKTSKIRRAHDNQAAIEALSWLKSQGKLRDQVLYAKYKKRK